jgi:Protein of unknown function (DUF1353)
MSSRGRREFLRQAVQAGASAFFGTLLSANLSFAEAEGSETERSEAVDAWIDQVIDHKKQLGEALFLGRFADPMYFLLRPITWAPNQGESSYNAVTVPEGFVTDLASIPRMFWSILQPDGLYAYAAVVHDFLYWTQSTSKDAADSIFRYTMEELGVGPWTIKILFEAVHLAGQVAWNENARLKASGERRILKVFPEDPRVRWREWKNDPAHFFE